jgi:hypothetical protein
MTELQIKLERLELMLVEDGYNNSNIVLQTLADAQELAINYSQCYKSDSELLKAFKNDETLALDGTLEVKIINVESRIFVKVIEDDTLMWVNKDRLKREYSF